MKIKIIIGLLFYMQQLAAQNFSLLPNGPVGQVHEAFADTINNRIFLGGMFYDYCVPYWNTVEWVYDNGNLMLANKIIDISYFKGELYATGTIQFWGQDSTMYGGSLLKWNGNEWIEIGDSIYSQGYDLYADSNYLYVCGAFDSIGGIISNKIAKYDGTNWYSFPTLDSYSGVGIYNAIEYKGDLYVGGNFDSQIASNMKDLAKWDGTSWQPVANGMSGPASWVNDFAVYRGDLIVAGRFQTDWGDPGNCIAAWDGNNWKTLGVGASPTQIVALQVYKDELYVGGQIDYAGNIPVSFIAKWDGANWHNVGLDFDNVVTDFAVLGGELYIAGGFWHVNGVEANCIIKYNSSTNSISPANAAEVFFTTYPNPATDELRMCVPAAQKIQAIYIQDLTGKQVLADIPFQIIGEEAIISVSNLPRGTYMLQIVIEGMTFSQKWVKQ